MRFWGGSFGGAGSAPFVFEGAFDLGLGLGFGVESEEVGEGLGGSAEVGLLMPRAREAGGPTGTMRDPNSTPIVTS